MREKIKFESTAGPANYTTTKKSRRPCLEKMEIMKYDPKVASSGLQGKPS